MTQFRDRAVGAGAAGVVGAVLWATGCGGSGSGVSGLTTKYYQSVSNLVKLQSSVHVYANDYDDVLPPPNRWMDALVPYTTDQTIFHSPAVASPGYGYAFNPAVAGLPLTFVASPDTVLLIFDSTDLSRNATDPPSTLPVPPRYGTKNSEAFADGRTLDQGEGLSPAALYSLSQSRIMQSATGLLQYAADHDENLPTAKTWMDSVAPYVSGDLSLFRSPAIENIMPSSFGYAMHSAIAGQNLSAFSAPSDMVSEFDSTDLLRNATDPTTTLPYPPRYGANNTIAYLDGHVR